MEKCYVKSWFQKDKIFLFRIKAETSPKSISSAGVWKQGSRFINKLERKNKAPIEDKYQYLVMRPQRTYVSDIPWRKKASKAPCLSESSRFIFWGNGLHSKEILVFEGKLYVFLIRVSMIHYLSFLLNKYGPYWFFHHDFLCFWMVKLWTFLEYC